MGSSIQVQNLNLNYSWKQHSKQIFNNLNLRIDPGQFVTVIGGNGSGKSSLIKLILGLVSPGSGIVSVNGHKVRAGYPQSVRQGQIAYLAQRLEDLFFAETVFEELNYKRGHHQSTIDKALDKLDLSRFLHRSIESLSGGERQALALAQYMTSQGSILLLDEPSSYLDQNHANILKAYLAESHEAGHTILHVTQYENEIAWGTHLIDLNKPEPGVESV